MQSFDQYLRSQLHRQLQRSPLLAASSRINRRLRRVCFLLREPATVAASPRVALPAAKEVLALRDRFIRMQYAGTLATLSKEHDANVLAYVAGDIEATDHECLEGMFRIYHRELMRRATVVNPYHVAP